LLLFAAAVAFFIVGMRQPHFSIPFPAFPLSLSHRVALGILNAFKLKDDIIN